MKWLLRLYPPEFQRRYRHEMEAQFDHDYPRLRTALDLVAGPSTHGAIGTFCFDHPHIEENAT